MKEDFIHYLWQFKKFDVLHLKTVDGEPIEIANVGEHNKNAGPDFFNAKLKIGNQEWAGNVELHLKSSDWYVHGHDSDVYYDTTILHVVWEYDSEVKRTNGTVIPTTELKPVVALDVQLRYFDLFSKQNKWINCESRLGDVPQFVIDNWLDRLYFERLMNKTEVIDLLLEQSNSDWEWVMFYLLSKNFGLKVNGEAFASMAKSIPFAVIRKVAAKQEDLEALFFGQSKLLVKPFESEYYKSLKSNYEYLSHKFQLNNSHVVSPVYFRLRPPNFPTIRLSQLSVLYNTHHNLFSNLIDLKSVDNIYKVFDVGVSNFWKTHYSFQSQTKSSNRKLSKSFIDLLVINTIIPLQFSYAKRHTYNWDANILQLSRSVKPESNSIVKGFVRLKLDCESAVQSQALIQLKTNYCDKNKCLQCEVGSSLISN
ncbi:MAG: hypothetical protein BM564_00565 [Bacteroidetes bacterium MedPE-SWsnd-G2]|nr:MAG: hypothetical protein BM564_00565 [Bacteroidetes bacterium MedPE-SWsnd-G2]